MNNCFIRGRFYFPLSKLTEIQIANFKSALTYVSPFEDDNGKRKTIRLYSVDETHIGLPIEWVKLNYPSLFSMAEDQRVTPGKLEYVRLPDPYHPNVRDPQLQIDFREGLLAAAKEHNNVFGVMGTGGGKTVCALYVAAMLGHKTLIFVDTNQLKLQWIAQIKSVLGVTEDKIGVIQQDKCEVEGKDIVVAMLPSQARREYPSEIYDAFGTIIVDEASVLATEFFGDILPNFNAKYRICLDATPNRKDGSDIAVFYHVGQPRVVADSLKMPVKVYPVKYYTQRKLWGKDDKQRVNCLVKDPDRNKMLVDYIVALHKAGRQVLIVSERIAQLEELMQMCVARGVPETAMGQYTNQKQTYDRVHTWKVVGKKNISSADLEIAKTRQLIFATIQMVKRAIDIPRLDAGIEASPMWQGAQLLGRIRRYQPGKLFPKWITIVDMKCEFSRDRYNNRLQEYRDCGAEIVV